jgi:lysine 2,3-aminomutase
LFQWYRRQARIGFNSCKISYKGEMSMEKVKYFGDIRKVAGIKPEDFGKLESVANKFAFRSNDYYSSLINWNDPDDPIKRLIIPDEDEMIGWGSWDASNERGFQVMPGLEHKYAPTALLLVNKVCGAYCRFCFRKRLFQKDNDEVIKDLDSAIGYINARPEITNVLLSGGDPLMMSTQSLTKILERLAEIPHIDIIRIGTKMPSFNPYRMIQDEQLLNTFASISPRKQLYIMVHFSHPIEFTIPSRECIGRLKRTGATLLNQIPIIRGVNDATSTFEKLFRMLSSQGIVPYYVFACRPTLGNKTYAVPIEEAYSIFESGRKYHAGLAKTARFILSHQTGKLEVIHVDESKIYFRNHNMVDPESNGRVQIYPRNPDAYWLDDYMITTENYRTEDLAKGKTLE